MSGIYLVWILFLVLMLWPSDGWSGIALLVFTGPLSLELDDGSLTK